MKVFIPTIFVVVLLPIAGLCLDLQGLPSCLRPRTRSNKSINNNVMVETGMSVDSIERAVKEAIKTKDLAEAEDIFFNALQNKQYVGIVPPAAWLTGTVLKDEKGKDVEGSIELRGHKSIWKSDWPLMNEDRVMNNFAIPASATYPTLEGTIIGNMVQIGTANIARRESQDLGPPFLSTMRDGYNVPFVYFIGKQGNRIRKALKTLLDNFNSFIDDESVKEACNTQVDNLSVKLSSIVGCFNLGMVQSSGTNRLYIFQLANNARIIDIPATRELGNSEWNFKAYNVAHKKMSWFRPVFDIVKYLNDLLLITGTRSLSNSATGRFVRGLSKKLGRSQSASERIVNYPLQYIDIKIPKEKGTILTLEIVLKLGKNSEKTKTIEWNYDVETGIHGDVLAQFISMYESQFSARNSSTTPFLAKNTFWMKPVKLLQMPGMPPQFYYDEEIENLVIDKMTRTINKQ